MSGKVREKTKTIKSSYRWELSRYEIENVNKNIASPCFLIQDSEAQLELYPEGIDSSNKYMSLFLTISNGCLKVTKFQLSILGNYNKKYAVFELEKFDMDTRTAWGTSHFILKSEYLRNENMFFSSDDVLTISCKLCFDADIDELSMYGKYISRNKRQRLQSISDTSFSSTNSCNQFEKYFDNERRSDVKFVLYNGKCIYAHSIVLESKSEVFENMFTSEASVLCPDIINIKDIDYDVLYETIRFIYSNKVNKLDKFAKRLLEPANRFMIDDLKELCEQYLCNNLTVNNVIDSLILAEDYDLTVLKKRGKEFVAMNMKDVVHSPEFVVVMTRRPSTALEIVRCKFEE